VAGRFVLAVRLHLDEPGDQARLLVDEQLADEITRHGGGRPREEAAVKRAHA
jgi:hypothetical protein